jgi:hypothetical protein
MALTDPHAPGATPLTTDQLKGLRNAFITTHAELNRAEQANIVRAADNHDYIGLVGFATS